MSKFSLGQVVMTQGARDLLDPIEALTYVNRHAQGDWGNMPEEDKEENERSLVQGHRLMSAYEVRGEKIWIITEGDRTVTTILLPDEY